jgi:hypothetical protein
MYSAAEAAPFQGRKGDFSAATLSMALRFSTLQDFHANLALSLAQSRYKLRLGSIVELSQAQLQQTQAQISYAQEQYSY